MFIEHASRKLEDDARVFYRDIKEEKVKKRILTIAERPLVKVHIFRKHEGFQSIQDSNIKINDQ